MSPRSRGFTLVEILVVMAIVVILASMLFGVFARVRENGRRTTCESNLHQIGLALQQYTSTNDGVYPPLSYFSTVAEVKWSDMLQPYLKSRAVFDCATHTQRYPTGDDVPAAPLLAGITGDYEYDWVRIPNAQHKLNNFGQNATEMQVELPTQSALVYDAGWIGDEKSLYYLQTFKEESDGSHTCYHSAHSGGANFLFADGHVKWMSVEQQANHSPLPLAPWSDWKPSD